MRDVSCRKRPWRRLTLTVGCLCAGSSILITASHAEPASPSRDRRKATATRSRKDDDDYETMTFPPPWVKVQTYDDYLLTRRLGTGKFSDVFEAVSVQLERDAVPLRRPDTAPDPSTLCVIKCLKPVSERKIRRELLMLHRCQNLVNLARLHAIVVDTSEHGRRSMPALVLQHAGPHAEWLCHATPSRSGPPHESDPVDASAAAVVSDYLTDDEIRYYLYHLLVAIDGLHSIGIMHRDIKPRNVLINRVRSPSTLRNPARRSHSSGSARLDSRRTPWMARTTLPSVTAKSATARPLMLIDLGLADFYTPDTLYNVRVASRHYKSPELLVGYEQYDYAIDMWGFGCIMAGLLLRREPFFRGKDNVNQLGKILSVLGSDDLLLFLLKYKVQVTTDVEGEIIKYHTLQKQQQQQERSEGLRLTGTTTNHGRTAKEMALLECRAPDCPIPSRDGMDLLLHLLVYDHRERWTARAAMAHPYFDGIRERVARDEHPVATRAASTIMDSSLPHFSEG